MTKTKALAVTASNEVLAQLAEAYPQEKGGTYITLPRLSLVSQDKTEETGKGKDKQITVIAAAGDFYTEKQGEEVDEEGKKIWDKEEIGTEFEGIIFFKRHQLKMYDEATEEFTSSPVYDSPDEVIPLWCDKKEVAKGTPAELKAKYMFTNKKGKEVSALEDNRILYVLYKGEAYQMNLRGSSMYSLLSYEKTVSAPTVVTEFSSEAMEKGEICWNKMTFKAVRKLTTEEAEKVAELQKEAIEAIGASKASFATAEIGDSKEFKKNMDKQAKDF